MVLRFMLSPTASLISSAGSHEKVGDPSSTVADGPSTELREVVYSDNSEEHIGDGQRRLCRAAGVTQRRNALDFQGLFTDEPDGTVLKAQR